MKKIRLLMFVSISIISFSFAKWEEYTIFQWEWCPYCANLDKYIEKNNIKDKYDIDFFEIWKSKTWSNVFQDTIKKLWLKDYQVWVPFMFFSNNCYLMWDLPIMSYFDSLQNWKKSKFDPICVIDFCDTIVEDDISTKKYCQSVLKKHWSLFDKNIDKILSKWTYSNFQEKQKTIIEKLNQYVEKNNSKLKKIMWKYYIFEISKKDNKYLNNTKVPENDLDSKKESSDNNIGNENDETKTWYVSEQTTWTIDVIEDKNENLDKLNLSCNTNLKISEYDNISFSPSNDLNEIFFVWNMLLYADYEDIRVEKIEIIFENPGNQNIQWNIEKVLIYDQDCKTILWEQIIKDNSKVNIDYISNLTINRAQSKKVFIAIKLKNQNQINWVENIRMVATPVEAISLNRWKKVEIRWQSKSALFTVQKTNSNSVSLIPILSANWLSNWNSISLAKITIPVVWSTDYNVLIRKLQPKIFGSAGVNISNIKIERLNIWYNSEFNYNELDNINSSSILSADKTKLIIAPNSTAEFIIRADVSWVSSNSSLSITLSNEDILFSVFDNWTSDIFAGNTFRPSYFRFEQFFTTR